MSNHSETEGLLSGRLNQSSLKSNFSDLHPPLNKHEASVAADRCYFCYYFHPPPNEIKKFIIYISKFFEKKRIL